METGTGATYENSGPAFGVCSKASRTYIRGPKLFFLLCYQRINYEQLCESEQFCESQFQHILETSNSTFLISYYGGGALPDTLFKHLLWVTQCVDYGQSLWMSMQPLM